MSDELFIEVPVTRRARITYVGHLVAYWPSRSLGKVHYHGAERLRIGDHIVCAPRLPDVRSGVGRAANDGFVQLRDVVGAREDDHVYRVEPE